MRIVSHFVALTICILTGGHLLDSIVENTISYIDFITIPLFCIATLFVIVLPNNNASQDYSKYINNLITWFYAMALTSILVLGVYSVRNYSTVVYDVGYYWEEGIRMTFMKNGRVRIYNENIVGASVSYDRYRNQGSFIVLEDDVMWGMAELHDTLHISSSGLRFSLKTSWRGIEEEIMTYRQ